LGHVIDAAVVMAAFYVVAHGLLLLNATSTWYGEIIERAEQLGFVIMFLNLLWNLVVEFINRRVKLTSGSHASFLFAF